MVLAVLAVLARVAFPASRRVPLFLGLVAYAAAIEVVQAALPWRSADALDLLAGAIGALVSLVVPPFSRSRGRRAV